MLCTGLAVQRRIPVGQVVAVAGVGGRLSGAMVRENDALADRAHQESGPDGAELPGVDFELVPGAERVFLGGSGRLKQQSEIDHKKRRMVISRFRRWKSPYIIPLGIFPNQNSATHFWDETKGIYGSSGKNVPIFKKVRSVSNRADLRNKSKILSPSGEV